MPTIRRPLAVAALSTTFALAGVASAFACGGGSGSQPGSYDGAGTYDGSTTTSTTTGASSTDASTTTSTSATAARKPQARKHGKRHSRRA